MLTASKRTVRLTPSQARTLTSIAGRRGLTEYAMLQRIIEAGFLAVMHGTDRDADTREIAAGVGVTTASVAWAAADVAVTWGANVGGAASDTATVGNAAGCGP